MLANFWGPYAVTIAGVVTTGVAAFAIRFVWRWATAPAPTLMRLKLIERGIQVINGNDFTIHVSRISQQGGIANAEYDRPRRIAPGNYTQATWEASSGVEIRVDQTYGVTARDDHFARWAATYTAHRSLSDYQGATPSHIERRWPKPISWAIQQTRLSGDLVRGQ